jgi:hypothetical protein
MEKVTIKTLVLAAAILSPNLVAIAAETAPIKQIHQLSAAQLRSTIKPVNGVTCKPSEETKKAVVDLKAGVRD